MDFYGQNDPFQSIDFKNELNDEQYAAVTSKPGPALVLAGAGSGKTRTLTYRVAWLIEQGIDPSNILLLTFTNKASKEMLHRVSELTGVQPHRFWGGTFHSIGQRTLRQFGEPVGFKRNYTIMDEDDSLSLLTTVIKDKDPKYLKHKDNPKPKIISSWLSFARNTLRPVAEIIEENDRLSVPLTDIIMGIIREYTKEKLDKQLADYDDLLEYWLKLLNTDNDIAEYFQHKFRHILVDEYQDTNLLQSAIIDKLGIHHNIMAVGDDAQCIYTWRGANFLNIMDFPERHPGTEIYKIETNYRSSPQILDLANGVLANQPPSAGYRKELRPTLPDRARPYVVPLIDMRQQAKYIIDRIIRLVHEGYQPKDVAILYRAHYQAMDLQLELSRQGIPFIITSGLRFFEQAHIKDLVAHLRIIANPDDVTAFVRLAKLLPRIGDRTANRLHKAISAIFQKNQRVAVKDMKGEDTEDEEFNQDLMFEDDSVFRTALLAPQVLKMVPKDAIEDWKELAHSLVDIEDALRHKDPEDVVKVALAGWYSDYIRTVYTNWEERSDDMQSLIGFAERFDSVNELLAQLVLLNSETDSKSYENDDDCLRLTTVHQAKGLEYPVVFVIGLADDLFPLKRAVENDNLDEERRLFYVAVTRAKEELFLTYPKINSSGRGGNMRMMPSRFVSDLPRSYYDIVRVPVSQYGW